MAPRNTDTGRSMLPIANRVSGTGGLTAAAVALALAAILQQELLDGTSGDRRVAAGAAADAPARQAPGGGTPVTTGPSGAAAANAAARPSALIKDVSTGVLARRGAVARRRFGGTVRAEPPQVVVSRIDQRRSWAFGTAAIPPADANAMPDASVFVARRLGARWQVAVAGDGDFLRLLRAAPADVVPRAERAVLTRFAAGRAAARAGADTGLDLPWARGRSWVLDRTNGDPAEARFSGGDGQVLAAGDGLLYRLCSAAPGPGMLMLIHGNGLASQYFPAGEVTARPDGTLVKRGEYLGRVSAARPCGGTAGTGGNGPAQPAAVPTLRLAVVSVRQALSLDGRVIGGWTLRIAPGRVGAERAGARVAAGGALLNPFPAAPPAPAPPEPAPPAPPAPATPPTPGAPPASPAPSGSAPPAPARRSPEPPAPDAGAPAARNR